MKRYLAALALLIAAAPAPGKDDKLAPNTEATKLLEDEEICELWRFNIGSVASLDEQKSRNGVVDHN